MSEPVAPPLAPTRVRMLALVAGVVLVGDVVTKVLAVARLEGHPPVALGLVLGGALGNLVDRVARAPGPLQGHVVSLFAPDGSVWPVFNLADSAIVCGGVLLVLLTLTANEVHGA